MAQIVLGMGSSHSPLLVLPVDEWRERSLADYANPELNLSDGRRVSYEVLHAEVGDRYVEEITRERLAQKAAANDAALDRLADELEAAAPDVVLIVGDDQAELFSSANQPAIAIYCGDEVVTLDKFGRAGAPNWMKIAGEGYLMDQVHTLPAAPDFALEIIESLLEHDIDITTVSRVDNPTAAGFGHAYGFIIKRLFKERRIPVLPVLLNTYYPPNVPSASRCHAIGRALRAAIESSPRDLRVAVIASGGLSHFVVDEELDRRVITALEQGDGGTLRALPRQALNSGSSEILNWVVVAGVFDGSPASWSEYVPVYRTPAGTGVGMAFAVWNGQSSKDAEG